MANMPTEDDMNQYYDSERLKGRTIVREGEPMPLGKSYNETMLNIAIEELKGTMIWLRDILSGIQ